MASDHPSLGTRIRRARERARLSQEDLARAVGASPRAVGDWENDRRRPRNRIGALEDVLGVSLAGEPPGGIVPQDEHERFILGNDTLGDDDKRLMIRSYRKAKAAFGPEPAPRPPAKAEDRSPGQAAASST